MQDITAYICIYTRGDNIFSSAPSPVFDGKIEGDMDSITDSIIKAIRSAGITGKELVENKNCVLITISGQMSITSDFTVESFNGLAEYQIYYHPQKKDCGACKYWIDNQKGFPPEDNNAICGYDWDGRIKSVITKCTKKGKFSELYKFCQNAKVTNLIIGMFKICDKKQKSS